MNNRTAVWIFAVIVLILVATLLLTRKNYFQPTVSGPTPQATSTPTPSLQEADFIHEGNLTKPATNWVLIYEKPGSPALQKILIFDSSSICVRGGISSTCDKSSFTVGERVKIEGFEEESRVNVIKIVFN